MEKTSRRFGLGFLENKGAGGWPIESLARGRTRLPWALVEGIHMKRKKRGPRNPCTAWCEPAGT